METAPGVKLVNKSNDTTNQPFLSPLGARQGLFARIRQSAARLPDAAVPATVTAAGAVTLVIVLAAMLGGETTDADATAVIAEQVAAPAASPPATAPVAAPVVVAEEPALTTAQEMPLAALAEPVAEIDTAEAGPPAEQPVPQTFTDPAQTASILGVTPTRNALLPEVEVAETEAEIASLEARQRVEVEEDIGPVDVQQAAASAPLQTAAAMQPAIAGNYVNLRAGPSDDAEVLMVVPANASIEAETDCNWCAVAYDGREGYIYKTFINYR